MAPSAFLSSSPVLGSTTLEPNFETILRNPVVPCFTTWRAMRSASINMIPLWAVIYFDAVVLPVAMPPVMPTTDNRVPNSKQPSGKSGARDDMLVWKMYPRLAHAAVDDKSRMNWCDVLFGLLIPGRDGNVDRNPFITAKPTGIRPTERSNFKII